MALLPVLPIFDINNRQRKPKLYRERLDSVAEFTDEEFRQRYRFTKAGFSYVLDQIRPDLQWPTGRSAAMSPEDQLCVALRFYATGAFLQLDGDSFKVDKSTVSRVVARVSSALCARLDEFVSMPTTIDELAQIQQGFFAVDGFPGVVGAVDCTHVRIQQPPGENAIDYLNRHSYFSINVQAVCDSNMRFLNVVADWPGGCHDSRIFSTSRIGIEFERRERHGYLLGDGGYPCRPWLLTPYLAPQTPAQRRYNMAQKRSRILVERAFGLAKRRFHVLHGEVRMRPERVCRVIGACIVLHNLALLWRDNPADLLDAPAPAPDPDDQENVPPMNGPQDGQLFRDHIVQRHF